MKKLISSILLCGMISSLACTPCMAAGTFKNEIHGCEQNCDKIRSTVDEALSLMTKNTGLEPTFTSNIFIFPDGNNAGYVPLKDAIYVAEKFAQDKNTFAHEMTHAEICKRLKTCNGLFPYKHSIGFEEGITSQNNPGNYSKENYIDFMLGGNSQFIRDIANELYSDENKPKLIFAPVNRGGHASYFVHQNLISEWIQEKGTGIITEMIDTVNEEGIFPEEFFLKNGGEQIILNQYGENGLKFAKRNLAIQKTRYYCRYAFIPLLALMADREIHSVANMFKLGKLVGSKLKTKLCKKNSMAEKTESTPEVINQEAESVNDLAIKEESKLQENNTENSTDQGEITTQNSITSPVSDEEDALVIEKNTNENLNDGTLLDFSVEEKATVEEPKNEHDTNTTEDKQESCKPIIKKILKYRFQENLLYTAAVALFCYCQQKL